MFSYAKDLDEKIKMLSITYDVCFKKVFSNKKLLKDMIISILELDESYQNKPIEIKNNEIYIDNKNEYRMRADILVILNNEIYVNIECNREKFLKYRNYVYYNRIYNKMYKDWLKEKRNKNFDQKKLYQININTSYFESLKEESNIKIYDLTKEEEYIKNGKIILETLAKYRLLYYNNKELSKKERYMMFLAAENFTDIYMSLKGLLKEEEIKKIIEEVFIMSNDEYIYGEVNGKEEYYYLMRSAQEEELKKVATKSREEGAKKILKNLRESGFSLEEIAKMTKMKLATIKNILL